MGETYEQHLAERESQNGVYASSRLWNTRPDALGLLGEREIARFFKVAQDLTNKPSGDGGVDRKISMAIPIAIDMKASSSGEYLIVNVSKLRVRTIYVLGHGDVDADTCELLGWEWSAVLRKAPVKDFGNRGVPAHYIHHSKLRDMQELLDHRVLP